MRQSRLLVGVGGQTIGARMARLAIGGREHDLAMQPFERPAIGHEARGQIVEQFGMRGLFALNAEIAGGGDQRLAEMPAPDAVHDDARGQRPP